MAARFHAKILNVDDDEAKRYSVTCTLQRAGYEVEEAFTGEEALRLAGKQPDLIILDVNLPDISGFEVVRRLKRDAETAGIPVLHFSATAVDPASRVEGLAGGADGYLAEPVESAELLATVDALLRTIRRAQSGAQAALEPPANVLLVDDDPASLVAVAGLLTDLGHSVVLANSGPEALRALLGMDFAVILMDVRMSGMSGFETATAIRERDRSRQTPIIFITAYSTAELTLEGYAHGAVDYLQKPLAPAVLRAKVQALVDLDRQARAARRQAEARQGAILRAALDGIVLTDHGGTVVDWNPAAERMFGYPRREAIGAALAELILPLSSQSACPRGLRDFLSEDVSPVAERRVELTACRRGGEEFPLELAVTAVPGDPPLYAGYLHDLTKRRRAEEALREADRRKDEFVAMLAHELRNPLAAIVNALAALDELAARSADGPHLRSVIRRQAAHLTRMTDDLLDLSRISTGRIPVARVPIDLCDAARDALETSQPGVQSLGHTLAFDCLDGPLWMEGDRNRLEQVFTNLLYNAVKYTPPGGQLRFEVRREGDEAVVTVRDSGIGMQPELLPEIFQLFTQAERSLDRHEGGLGIGLALVWQIVHLHDGSVTAYSAGLGQGSDFVVRLPLGRPPELPTPSPPTARPAGEAGSTAYRVLVVEDNLDAGDTLTELLELWGHTSRLALDGPSAVAAVAEFEPDVVLLDIGLPVFDGYEVARRIRGRLGPVAPRLIALSGYGPDQDRERARKAGMDTVLVKPVAPDELKRLLSNP